MTGSYPAKRIEIILDEPLLPRVLAALRAAGVTGHSAMRLMSGHGEGGSWTEERVTSAESKLMVIAVASAAHADDALTALAPLLDSYGMLLTIADVAVARPGKFA